MPLGRPTEYKSEDADKIREMAAAGATDTELADYLGVSVRTLYRWRGEHKEFRHACKMGKQEADDRVEQSLYHRAVGFERDSVKIFMPAGAESPVFAEYREYFPPDTAAAKHWLNNRKPAEWREKSEVDIPGLSALADRISKARLRK